jgi:hypothetical protein
MVGGEAVNSADCRCMRGMINRATPHWETPLACRKAAGRERQKGVMITNWRASANLALSNPAEWWLRSGPYPSTITDNFARFSTVGFFYTAPIAAAASFHESQTIFAAVFTRRNHYASCSK